jgi:hypothetical protein
VFFEVAPQISGDMRDHSTNCLKNKTVQKPEMTGVFFTPYNKLNPHGTEIKYFKNR